MLKRVKKWLGIDGVKIEVFIQDAVIDKGQLKGEIHLYSKEAEVVEEIGLKLVEKYSRGRGKSKLIDKYVLGEESLLEVIELDKEDEEVLSFEMSFEPLRSDMDQWGRKNPVFKGLASAAKMMKRVKSTYSLELSARVRGRALQPTLIVPVDFS